MITRLSSCCSYLENAESSSERLQTCMVYDDPGNVLVKPYSLASDAALLCLLRFTPIDALVNINVLFTVYIIVVVVKKIAPFPNPPTCSCQQSWVGEFGGRVVHGLGPLV